MQFQSQSLIRQCTLFLRTIVQFLCVLILVWSSQDQWSLPSLPRAKTLLMLKVSSPLVKCLTWSECSISLVQRLISFPVQLSLWLLPVLWPVLISLILLWMTALLLREIRASTYVWAAPQQWWSSLMMIVSSQLIIISHLVDLFSIYSSTDWIWWCYYQRRWRHSCCECASIERDWKRLCVGLQHRRSTRWCWW